MRPVLALLRLSCDKGSMFSVYDTASRITAIVGPVAGNGTRDRFIFNKVATCIAFLKVCQFAADHRKLRDVLTRAQISYASFWRLAHGCRSFGMSLTIWPALREAMTAANLEIRPITAGKVYEADGDDILEHRTVVSQETIAHVPGSDGFEAIVAELAPEVEVDSGMRGNFRTSIKPIGGRKIQAGTPAFAKLVKRIVAGEFIG